MDETQCSSSEYLSLLLFSCKKIIFVIVMRIVSSGGVNGEEISSTMQQHSLEEVGSSYVVK